jgi:hypothetical protein
LLYLDTGKFALVKHQHHRKHETVNRLQEARATDTAAAASTEANDTAARAALAPTSAPTSAPT